MGTIAEKLNYLNTTKANIKNAIIEKGVSVSDNDTFRSYASKIADIEPTLGTKTITANGTYNASDDNLRGYSSVTVDIDDTDLYRDTTDSTYESVKTLSNCGAFPMLSLTAEINAVQDLHGYDSPWVGGAGKNKCPVNELDNVGWGAENSDLLAFFNGLSNGTYNISFKSKIKTLTSTSNTWVTGFYIIAPSGIIDARITTSPPFDVGSIISSNTTFQITDTNRGTFTELYVYGVGDNQIGGVGTATITEIQVEQGSAYTGYAPYSNICPISGWDEVNIVVSPTTDAEDGHTYTIQFKDGDNPLTVYGGTLDVLSGLLTITDGYIASYNGETLPSTWISDRDVYAEGSTPTTGAEVVYELATPTTATSDAIDLTLAEGVNNIWANSGDVGDARYFKKVEL